jgi:site-specific DNA-methyltransferase (adenine-specific)
VLLSASFDPRAAAPTALSPEAERLLAEGVRILRPGGLLFVYGHPRELPGFGVRLAATGDADGRMVFKYWIALDLDDTPRADALQPAHRGLLLFMKDDAGRRKPSAPPLNSADVKVPHAFCAACGKNLKDWGGKKHQMNPKGTALSDVWRDLPRTRLRDSVAPEPVLERIRALTAREGVTALHIIQLPPRKAERRSPVRPALELAPPSAGREIGASFPVDEVLQEDCVAFLNRVAATHPAGLFDLAFADPPYNLAKDYADYDDAQAEHDYLAWCEQWLDGMARALKPGGSLFVLNLPKWALHHARFLNARLEFRHWIAWDALGDPRGRLMPAHYALLYYTKPGAKPVFHYSPLGKRKLNDAVQPPDAPKYCLRAACVRDRKARGDDDKVELSDIWWDIHRIKHKRDRDAHPCQLPEKLMERIIRLASPPGGLVFDPFCGAGTTAIAARKLGRHFLTTECDAKYVRITREKLAAMQRHADLFGEFLVPRAATRKEKSFITKRAIETFLQDLAQKLGRVPTEEEIHAANGEMLAAMDRLYPYRGAALKRCKVALVAK